MASLETASAVGAATSSMEETTAPESERAPADSAPDVPLPVKKVIGEEQGENVHSESRTRVEKVIESSALSHELSKPSDSTQLKFLSTREVIQHLAGSDTTLGASEVPNNSGFMASSLLLDPTSSFDNNVVSIVDGEPVLIVENLVFPPYTPQKEVVSGSSDITNQEKDTLPDGKSRPSNAADGLELVGRKIKKKFGKKFFEGNIIHYDTELNWFKVAYADGDEEELDYAEVKRSLVHCSTDNERRTARKRSTHENDQAAEEEEEPVQKAHEKRTLRAPRRQNVIETSHDDSAEPLDTDGQASESLDQGSDTSERSESEDDSASEPLYGSRRKARRKKRKLNDSSRGVRKRKSDIDGEFAVSEPRPVRRHKVEETLSEQHRLATRSSTGSFTSPSANSSHRDRGGLHEKSSIESPALNRLGGGMKLVGCKTKKDFGGQFYTGEIVGYDSRAKYYKVRYEDGDEEELEWNELEATILPQEQVLALEAPYEAVRRFSNCRLKEHSRRISTPKSKQALVIYEGGTNNGDPPSSARRWRKKIRTASVSVMMKGTEELGAANSSYTPSRPIPRPLVTARFASASDADVFEYFGWGEVVNLERSKCPEIRATKLLPTSSPVVHLAASRHHLAALTAVGQVWVWRCKHGNIHTRCNEWEHISVLDNQNIILIDISGPDADRVSASYLPEQEDQVPDPFYLAAISSSGEDFVLQGSRPHESVRTYQNKDEPQHVGLRDALHQQSNPDLLEDVGRVVQVSVGVVESADESPFVGYITDSDHVYIRSATRDYMEEVNLVTGYTGKPLKIQCGRVYHAIILTDDGRAWTWGEGYYPGSNSISSNFGSKWSSPFSVCQPAVGTLVGRKVVDVGCYGEDFIALTSDGDVHQWTHAVPNPAAGVYNVPATPIYGQGPNIPSGDKLKQVSIGAGVCAGITESGKVHTWRTSMKGGFVGVVGLEGEALTPLAREEGYKETVILAFGSRVATKIMCIASSLLVVVRRKARGRRGGRRKLDSSMKGNPVEDKLTTG